MHEASRPANERHGIRGVDQDVTRSYRVVMSFRLKGAKVGLHKADVIESFFLRSRSRGRQRFRIEFYPSDAAMPSDEPADDE